MIEVEHIMPAPSAQIPDFKIRPGLISWGILKLIPGKYFPEN